jgi:DNA-binding response OmpR family regulator
MTGRVLCVDDDAHVRAFIERVLVGAGHEFVAAANADEARERLAEQPFSAVLCDINLPGRSGLDLLRELRGRAQTREFPVIVLTAEGDDRVLQEAEQLGAVLLTKPFSPTKLTARIAALLGDAPANPSDAR